MENGKVKLTIEEFEDVMGKVNMNNCANFDTLEENLMDEFGDKGLKDEIIDILEADYSIMCDADLEDLVDGDLRNIIERINEE